MQIGTGPAADHALAKQVVNNKGKLCRCNDHFDRDCPMHTRPETAIYLYTGLELKSPIALKDLIQRLLELDNSATRQPRVTKVFYNQNAFDCIAIELSSQIQGQ